MQDNRIPQYWLTGPQLRARWAGMPNSTFYDRLSRGLIPEPEYPFGPNKPHWRGSKIAEFESAAERVAA